jgi:hypothetical protein
MSRRLSADGSFNFAGKPMVLSLVQCPRDFAFNKTPKAVAEATQPRPTLKTQTEDPKPQTQTQTHVLNRDATHRQGRQRVWWRCQA